MWTAAKLGYRGNTNYDRAYYGDELVWERDPNDYFYIEALEDGVLMKINYAWYTGRFEYSYDKKNWTRLGGGNGNTIRVEHAGEKIYCRADRSLNPGNNNVQRFYDFNSKKFNIGGDIMTLAQNVDLNIINPDSTAQYEYGLFSLILSSYLLGTSTCRLVDASKLILPDVNLGGMYNGMFRSCPYLEKAPIFRGTKSYTYTFWWTFNECPKLNNLTCLVDEFIGSANNLHWLEGVSATGTFYKNPNMNSWPRGDSGIPSGWTVLDYQG